VKDSIYVIVFYLAVLILQVLWHGLLPPPHGNQSGLLALIATVPLLFPLRGILAGSIRSMTWGGYLLVLYFVIGVMEAWSNPPQRIAAVLQFSFSLLYVTSLVILTRQRNRQAQP
jgi:uncharacterized membrane protein